MMMVLEAEILQWSDGFATKGSHGMSMCSYAAESGNIPGTRAVFIHAVESGNMKMVEQIRRQACSWDDST